MPERIQRKRSKGWRMPASARYVGRPGPMGNPFPTAAQFERWVDGWEPPRYVGPPPSKEQIKRELAGYDLACWCGLDEPCHADVLLRIANE